LIGRKLSLPLGLVFAPGIRARVELQFPRERLRGGGTKGQCHSANFLQKPGCRGHGVN